jgi:hypothetical protein
MQFSERNGVHRVVRMTGPGHNLLGLRLTLQPGAVPTEVVDLEAGRAPPRLQPGEVEAAVLRGLQRANEAFSTAYRAERIEYVGSDSPPVRVYEDLAFALVAHVRSAP